MRVVSLLRYRLYKKYLNHLAGIPSYTPLTFEEWMWEAYRDYGY